MVSSISELIKIKKYLNTLKEIHDQGSDILMKKSLDTKMTLYSKLCDLFPHFAIQESGIFFIFRIKHEAWPDLIKYNPSLGCDEIFYIYDINFIGLEIITISLNIGVIKTFDYDVIYKFLNTETIKFDKETARFKLDNNFENNLIEFVHNVDKLLNSINHNH